MLPSALHALRKAFYLHLYNWGQILASHLVYPELVEGLVSESDILELRKLQLRSPFEQRYSLRTVMCVVLRFVLRSLAICNYIAEKR